MKYIILFLILIILVAILLNFYEKFSQEGVYKKTPFKFNSRKILDSKDEGILINLRPELKANTFSYELNYNDMNLLLSNIINKEYLFNPGKNVNENLSKAVVSELNNKFTEINPNNEFHTNDKRKYKMVNYDTLKEEDISKITKRSIININFYKDMKDISYVIQVDVLYGMETRTFKIKNISIVGINMNDKHLIKNLDSKQKFCDLENYNKKTDSKLIKCHDEVILEKEEMKTFFKNLIEGNEQELSKAELNFFKEKEDEKKKHEDYKKYMCIGTDGFNESTCNAYSFSTGRKGVWDRPCSKNEECPFYKKNKNYPNERGKCINGYCEMPLNVIRKGFRKFDETKKPFCHGCNIENCKGEECFLCCEQQENAQNLKSPDYMFENDTTERSSFLN